MYVNFFASKQGFALGHIIHRLSTEMYLQLDQGNQFGSVYGHVVIMQQYHYMVINRAKVTSQTREQYYC